MYISIRVNKGQGLFRTNSYIAVPRVGETVVFNNKSYTVVEVTHDLHSNDIIVDVEEK